MHSKCLILLPQFPGLRVNYGAQKRAWKQISIQHLQPFHEARATVSVQARRPELGNRPWSACMCLETRLVLRTNSPLIAATLHFIDENQLRLFLACCAST